MVNNGKDRAEKEWTADVNDKLTIPKEITATQRFRWVASNPLSLAGTCAQWSSKEDVITLTDVLIDTSQRVGGVTLIKRITHRTELIIAMNPVTIFPFSDEELRNDELHY